MANISSVLPASMLARSAINFNANLQLAGVSQSGECERLSSAIVAQYRKVDQAWAKFRSASALEDTAYFNMTLKYGDRGFTGNEAIEDILRDPLFKEWRRSPGPSFAFAKLQTEESKLEAFLTTYEAICGNKSPVGTPAPDTKTVPNEAPTDNPTSEMNRQPYGPIVPFPDFKPAQDSFPLLMPLFQPFGTIGTQAYDAPGQFDTPKTGERGTQDHNDPEEPPGPHIRPSTRGDRWYNPPGRGQQYPDRIRSPRGDGWGSQRTSLPVIGTPTPAPIISHASSVAATAALSAHVTANSSATGTTSSSSSTPPSSSTSAVISALRQATPLRPDDAQISQTSSGRHSSLSFSSPAVAPSPIPIPTLPFFVFP